MECIIQSGALLKCVLDPGETAVILPKGIYAIGRRAFYNNQQLVSVEIPDSVKHIGTAVFAYCRNLRSVKLPGGLKTIGQSAFGSCYSLKQLLVPKDFLVSEDVHTSIRQFQFRKYRLVKSATDEPLKQNLILLKNSLPNVQTSNCIVFSHTTYWGCCTIR